MTMKNIARLDRPRGGPRHARAFPSRAQWGPEEEKNCFLKRHEGHDHALRPDQRRPGRLLEARAVRGDPRGRPRSVRRVLLEQREVLLRRQGHRRRLRRPVPRRPRSAGRAASSSASAGTRTPTGSPTRPARRTPRPSRRRLHRAGLDAARAAERLHAVGGPDVEQPRRRRAALPPTRPYRASTPSRTTSTWACRTFDLRYVRKTGRAGFEVPVGKSLVFNASYSRETRDGNKNTTFYGGPDYEVATPIDFMTDNFRFGGDFAQGPLLRRRLRGLQPVQEPRALRRDRQPRAARDEQPDPNGRTIFNDATFFRLGCTRQRGLQVGRHRRHHAARRATSSRRSLSTGKMRWTRCCATSRPTPTCGAQPPNPLFTVVPPYGSVEAEYDTFMGQVRFTGDPIRWLGYIRVLAQVRARGQDRGLPLHEHASAATWAPPTAPPASPASTRAGASRRCAARST